MVELREMFEEILRLTKSNREGLEEIHRLTKRMMIKRRPPTRIALELPSLTKRGKVMPNYELPNDVVATITIHTTDSEGDVEPVPAGDVFTVVSSNPASLGAAIGVDGDGNPAVVLTPLVKASPNLTITVSDSAGLAQAIQLVDIVADVTDKNIVLDLVDATTKTQPVPTAPGP